MTLNSTAETSVTRLTLPLLSPAQECESSPHCRRLQLRDLLVSEMQRLTKYPLLLDNILKHTEGEASAVQTLAVDQSVSFCSLLLLQPALGTCRRSSVHRRAAEGSCRPSTRSSGKRNTGNASASISAGWTLVLSSRFLFLCFRMQ